MLFSRKEAVLEQLRAIEIHGARFYDLLLSWADAPGAPPEAARIGGEMIYADPREGDRVVVERIANVVARVEKV